MNYYLTKDLHGMNKTDIQTAYCDFATCDKKATTTIRVPISENEKILLNFCYKCAFNFNRNGLREDE